MEGFLVNHTRRYRKIQKILIVTTLAGSLLISSNIISSSKGATTQNEQKESVKTAAVAKEQLGENNTLKTTGEANSNSIVKELVSKDVSVKSGKNQNPLSVPLINQFKGHYLRNGCEVTSLAMILNYHGIKVTKTELFNKADKVPWKYKNGLSGNPNEGFVGDMEHGPGLSMYHGPIMKLAKKYVGKKADDLTGSKVSEIYKQIDHGLPVWVIITATFSPTNDFITWKTSQGKIKVTYNIHSVVITGYNKNFVYFNNPFGKKNQKVNRTNFEKAWKQLGSQAIVIKK